MKSPYSLLTALAAAGLLSPPAAVALESVVSPSNLNGWVFSGDGAPRGSASFVAGPGTAPLGTGSVQLGVDATQRVLLATGAHAGTRLDSIAALSYSTWSADPATSAISLQFDIDYDVTDANTAWQGTLVFKPAGPVVPGTWQSWNALTGTWYNSDPAQPFPVTAPATIAAILLAHPNAGISATVGSLGLKADGAVGALTGNADALVLNITGDEPLTYNFEPDSDGDGVANIEDHCPISDIRAVVDVGMGLTTIVNSVDDHGCTIQDLVNKLQAAARNHGKYVSGIAKLANDLRKAGTITSAQSQEMKTGAAHSTIGKPSTQPGGNTGNGNNGNGNNGNGNNGNGNGNGNGHGRS